MSATDRLRDLLEPQRGGGMVDADTLLEILDAEPDPAAPGHRRLRDILADVHQVDPGADATVAMDSLRVLRAEGDAAWAALFDSQVAAALARRGPWS